MLYMFSCIVQQMGKIRIYSSAFLLVWVGLWMMIVANDVIYQKIVTPVWVAMLILTFVYFVFCVQKSLVFDEKILEDYTYEIRI